MRISLLSWLFIILLTINFFEINVVRVSSYCQSDQQGLLLRLKDELNFDSSSSCKLMKWNQSLDCCMWEGVTCDIRGHVTDLDLSDEGIFNGIDDSSSLFNLQHLQSLNLADNDFNSTFPSGFDKLAKLRHLHLSDTGFTGQIPLEISRMTSLVTLDLSVDAYLENPNLVMLVQNLKELKHLDLDGVNISTQGKEWCQVLSSLPNLQVLSMSNCYLSGPIDSSLSKLQSLSVIRLDGNNLSGPIDSSLSKLQSLSVIRLDGNNLSGQFPEEIFHVRTLKILDLSDNPLLEGSLKEFLPSSSLETLLLSDTSFGGTLPESIGNLGKLSRIELSSCNFSGLIPEAMANLIQLVSLDFSGNSFSGPIPSFSLAKNLTTLNLANNHLNGSILSTNWSSLPMLESITLGNNLLTGTLPTSLFCIPSIWGIELSQNQFTGQLNVPSDLASSTLYSLKLGSNRLVGPVPMFVFGLQALQFLNLSSNKFSGPLNISSLSNLNVLDLSNNYLNGNIPQCLTNKTGILRVLDLSRNNLNGNIPDVFSSGSVIQTLDLNGNHLEGKIPRSLANCTFLEVLDLGNNQINDTFPCYLKNISSLQVLVLRSNNFHGLIGCLDYNTSLPMLHIVDLASNHFMGELPYQWLRTWEAMMVVSEELKFLVFEDNNDYEEVYYQDAVTLTYKGVERRFPRILSLFTSIDFSCNKFKGRIPEVLGEFKALTALNLSHNSFTGLIPSSLGNLRYCESLDLSSNNLSGGIPQQLADLNFLAVLNLSHNQLEGRIPSGRQFQTFSEDSFKDNKGLCGMPLKENCSANVVPTSEDKHSDDGSHINWNFLSAELGFVFGFGIVILPLMFWKRWRVLYCKRVDGLLSKFFPQLNQGRRNHGRETSRRTKT
ncbi:hypothetical protein SLA2020_070680 [Shorea laevis]